MNRPLAHKHIVLGIAGGIAAYKAVEICRQLQERGASVTPVLTASALNFVGLATFRALATNEPLVDLFDASDPIPHTRLAQSADLILVAPATANIIAKFATGLADDALSTTLVASAAPVILAAAMHTEMWMHPAVIDNVARIRARGFTVIDPEVGRLAGGDIGVGRLADTEGILAAVTSQLKGDNKDRPLSGIRFLVTAGGTRESIDPVRYIGNRSSGKQGIAIARQASAQGAVGILVSTVSAPSIEGFEVRYCESALEMRDAVMALLDDSDVLVMCAAVADFRVAEVALGKIKKAGSAPEIKLVENPDILVGATSYLRERAARTVVVGFAAETENALENGRAKLLKKGVDLLVVNDVTQEGTAFGSDTNAVWILGADSYQERIELAAKDVIASRILEEISKRLSRPRPATESN